MMLPAVGASMLPSILPGARLEVEPVLREEIRVGDVVCYPGDSRTMVAHRVVGLRDDAVLLRGDAQIEVVEIPFAAVAHRVCRVQYPFGAYAVEDRVGRLFARLAVEEGTWWRLGRKAGIEATWFATRAARRLRRLIEG